MNARPSLGAPEQIAAIKAALAGDEGPIAELERRQVEALAAAGIYPLAAAPTWDLFLSPDSYDVRERGATPVAYVRMSDGSSRGWCGADAIEQGRAWCALFPPAPVREVA